MVDIINSYALDALRVYMGHQRTWLTGVSRRRHLELALMTLIALLITTMNGENLDVATDPDQTTDELAVENSAAFHGTLTGLQVFCTVSQNNERLLHFK